MIVKRTKPTTTCMWCEETTDNITSRECFRCWKIRTAVQFDIPIAEKIIKEIKKVKKETDK